MDAMSCRPSKQLLCHKAAVLTSVFVDLCADSSAGWNDTNRVVHPSAVRAAPSPGGEIRYIGISEACPEDVRAAHAVVPLSAVQMEWSLWSR